MSLTPTPHRGPVFIIGSIQEEECEGLAYKAIFDVEKLLPHFVVLTMPTGMRIARGHRGRAEIRVTLRGQPVNVSNPDKGFNAIYGMNKIIEETGCKIVLSSAWRYLVHGGAMTLDGLDCLFCSHGLKKGVIVRPFPSLPTSLRVTLGTERENDRFLVALGEVLP